MAISENDPPPCAASHCEAGKADIAEIGRHGELAEIETGLSQDHAAGLALGDEIDLHGRRKNKTAMQRHQGEANIFRGPDVRCRLAADGDILLVGEAAQGLGQVAVRRLKWLF